MPAEVTFERASEADVPALARNLSLAFAGTPDASEAWVRTLGLENLRVLRQPDGTVPASLARIPMGQFFGGKSVPMVGIAGVAVAPEARGRGLALRLMQEAVAEMGRERVPLSCLYASTQALYRQVGYEQAGFRCRIRIPLATIGVRDKGLAVAALGREQEDAVRACYRSFAAKFNGMLDRGVYCWNRVHELRGEVFHGFGVEGPAGLEGYVFFSLRRKPETGRYDVAISDLAFTTAGAGRRLLTLLGDMATVGDEAVLFGGPWHPLLALMPQQKHSVEGRDYWMLRITSVREAMESRGYSPGCRVSGLHISDDLVPENRGVWSLDAGGARVALETHGVSEAAWSIGAVAPVYAGLLTAEQAGLAGLGVGNPACISMTGMGMPWMPDMF